MERGSGRQRPGSFTALLLIGRLAFFLRQYPYYQVFVQEEHLVAVQTRLAAHVVYFGARDRDEPLIVVQLVLEAQVPHDVHRAADDIGCGRDDNLERLLSYALGVVFAFLIDAEIHSFTPSSWSGALWLRTCSDLRSPATGGIPGQPGGQSACPPVCEGILSPLAAATRCGMDGRSAAHPIHPPRQRCAPREGSARLASQTGIPCRPTIRGGNTGCPAQRASSEWARVSRRQRWGAALSRPIPRLSTGRA